MAVWHCLAVSDRSSEKFGLKAHPLITPLIAAGCLPLSSLLHEILFLVGGDGAVGGGVGDTGQHKASADLRFI